MSPLSKLGRYELRHVLGQGAMGVVYEGYDPALSRRVAVKSILQSHALGPEARQDYSVRFEREAKAAARLNHPNIVQVYDFGLEGEIAYLVMEFIQGRELGSLFEKDETFGIEESVRIMCELLDALDFAHEAGIIHRDVKPANVILDSRRRVKLADFGVARIQDGADRSMGGTMVGTPAYMSPEQIQGAKIDRRTDIFSAGCILYQFLTGEKAFKGAGAWTVSKMIVQQEPARPSSINNNVSSALDDVVKKSLAKDKTKRFPRARDFAVALREALTSEPSEARNDLTVPMPSSGEFDAKCIRIASEDDAWEQALIEFESGARKRGIWAKAFAEAKGDEAVAQANYLRVRAEQLLAEHHARVATERSSVTQQAPAARQDPPTDLPAEQSRLQISVPMGRCPNCSSQIPLASEECINCKALFGQYAAWKVEPN